LLKYHCKGKRAATIIIEKRISYIEQDNFKLKLRLLSDTYINRLCPVTAESEKANRLGEKEQIKLLPYLPVLSALLYSTLILPSLHHNLLLFSLPLNHEYPAAVPHQDALSH
jgi:hypothetical protein